MIRTLAATLATSTCFVALATPAAAQTREYNIPARSLKSALDAYVRQSGRQIVYRADQVRSARSPGTRGQHSAEAALANILAGSGFATRVDGNLIAIVREGNDQPIADLNAGQEDARGSVGDSESGEITVTGSRIAGRQSPSPTVVISREEIRSSGKASLTEVIRSIPQNFSGGQNPGVSFTVPQNTGENIGSGSSINLRGIGPDATLVLLNGQRLVYGGYRQSIDVGMVPIEAIERLEVVTDGASAIYGSDAVAGVANIILRRDYQGLNTSVRVGGATDGGFDQVRLGAVAGAVWTSGGLMATYEYARETAVESEQRSFTALTNPGQTLYPNVRRHNSVVGLHQELGSSLIFRLDGVYSWRKDSRRFASGTTATATRTVTGGPSWILALSPSLAWKVSDKWTVKVIGSYGVDHSRIGTDTRTTGAFAPTLRICYCNAAWSGEVNAEGPLFRLPGGDARIAFGSGTRSNKFQLIRTIGNPLLRLSETQDSFYGFGEISLPLVAPEQETPWLHSLTLNGAVRYENFKGVADVATPKLGLVFAPTRGLYFKATWSKSFKAPTLFQRYNLQTVGVRLASARGGVGLPATSTILELTGGNADLKPEHATNWTVSVEAAPSALPGLRITASYFNVDFRDRIVVPITNLPRTLSDPSYTLFVTRSPSAAAITDALAGRFFSSTTVPGPFNPANVVAISDNRSRNVARQLVRGVDLSLNYKHQLRGAGSIDASFSGSYLESDQQYIPGVAATVLAGTYFNPSQVKLRGGLVWRYTGFDLGLFADHSSGVKDNRTIATEQLDGMTTFDLSASYEFGSDRGALQGTRLTLSAQNLFDQAPPASRTTAIFDVPYDSTNYSPLGRVLSVTLAKQW